MPKVRSTAKPQRKGNRFDLRLFGGIFAFGLLILLSAFLFGRSDTGQIDVAATITTSNEERVKNGDTSAPTPVPRNTGKPFGGLIPSGKEDVTPPPPEPDVEGSATSSEEMASSTDAEANTDTDTSVEGEVVGEAEEVPVESTDNGEE